MKKFLKTCYSCGAKVEKLYEGVCQNCIKEKNKPIKELKEMNFKIDNYSGKVGYNNYYYTVEELEVELPNFVRRKLVIDPQYKLVDLQVRDVEVDGHKLTFEIDVECELK